MSSVISRLAGRLRDADTVTSELLSEVVEAKRDGTPAAERGVANSCGIDQRFDVPLFCDNFI